MEHIHTLRSAVFICKSGYDAVILQPRMTGEKAYPTSKRLHQSPVHFPALLTPVSFPLCTVFLLSYLLTVSSACSTPQTHHPYRYFTHHQPQHIHLRVARTSRDMCIYIDSSGRLPDFGDIPGAVAFWLYCVPWGLGEDSYTFRLWSHCLLTVCPWASWTSLSSSVNIWDDFPTL